MNTYNLEQYSNLLFVIPQNKASVPRKKKRSQRKVVFSNTANVRVFNSENGVSNTKNNTKTDNGGPNLISQYEDKIKQDKRYGIRPKTLARGSRGSIGRSVVPINKYNSRLSKWRQTYNGMPTNNSDNTFFDAESNLQQNLTPNLTPNLKLNLQQNLTPNLQQNLQQNLTPNLQQNNGLTNQVEQLIIDQVLNPLIEPEGPGLLVAIDAQNTLINQLGMTNEELQNLTPNEIELMLSQMQMPNISNDDNDNYENDGDENVMDLIDDEEEDEEQYAADVTEDIIEDLLSDIEQNGHNEESASNLNAVLNRLLNMASSGSEIETNIIANIIGRLYNLLKNIPNSSLIRTIMRFLRVSYYLMPSLYEDIIPLINEIGQLISNGAYTSQDAIVELLNGLFDLLPSIPEIRPHLMTLLNMSMDYLISPLISGSVSLSRSTLRSILRLLNNLMNNFKELSHSIQSSLEESLPNILRYLGESVRSFGVSGMNYLCVFLGICRDASLLLGISLRDLVMEFIPSAETVQEVTQYLLDSSATASGLALRELVITLRSLLRLISIVSSNAYNSFVDITSLLGAGLYNNILIPLGRLSLELGAITSNAFVELLRNLIEIGGNIANDVITYCQNEGMENLRNLASLITKGANSAAIGLFKLLTKIVGVGGTLTLIFLSFIKDVIVDFSSFALRNGMRLSNSLLTNFLHYGSITSIALCNLLQSMANAGIEGVELMFDELVVIIPQILGFLQNILSQGSMALARTIIWILSSLFSGTIDISSRLGVICADFIREYGPVLIDSLTNAFISGSAFAGRLLLSLGNLLLNIINGGSAVLKQIGEVLYNSLKFILPKVIGGLMNMGISIFNGANKYVIVGGTRISYQLLKVLGLGFVNAAGNIIGLGGRLIQQLLTRERYIGGNNYFQENINTNVYQPMQSQIQRPRGVFRAGRTRGGIGYTNPNAFNSLVLRPRRQNPDFKYGRGGYISKKQKKNIDKRGRISKKRLILRN